MSSGTYRMFSCLVFGCLAVTLAVLVASPAGADREHFIAAFFVGYVPEEVTITEGDTLTFENTDPFAGEGHTVTQATPDGVAPRFDTDVTPFGESASVRGVAELTPGRYLIRCRIHAIMEGALFVGPRVDSPAVPMAPAGP